MHQDLLDLPMCDLRQLLKRHSSEDRLPPKIKVTGNGLSVHQNWDFFTSLECLSCTVSLLKLALTLLERTCASDQPAFSDFLPVRHSKLKPRKKVIIGSMRPNFNLGTVTFLIFSGDHN